MKQISLLFILLMCTVTGTLGAADDDFNSTAVDHGSSKSMHPRLGKRLLSQGVVKNEHSNLEHPYSHTIQIPALIAAEMDDIVIDMWRAIHPGTQARLRQPEFEGKTYGHVADNRGGWKDYVGANSVVYMTDNPRNLMDNFLRLVRISSNWQKKMVPRTEFTI